MESVKGLGKQLMQTCAIQRCAYGVKIVCVPVTFSTGGTFEEKQRQHTREIAPAEPKVNCSPDLTVFSLSVFDFYSFLLDKCLWHQEGIDPPALGTIQVVVQGNVLETAYGAGAGEKEHVDTVVHIVPNTSQEQER